VNRQHPSRLLFFFVALLFACKREPVKVHGYSYLYTTEARSDSESRLMTARVYAAGDSSRIEYDEGDGMVLPKHTVVLSKDSGRNLIVLSGDERTFYKISADDLARRITERFKTKAGAMNLDVSNVRSHVSDDGPDGYVDTFPVDKYILTLSYDVRVSQGTFAQTVPSQMRARVWTTQKVPEKHFAFLGEHGAHSGFAELDQHLSAASKQIHGFPMRQTSEMHITFGSDERSTAETSEVKELKETDLDASLFEVPENYSEVSPKGRI
jgi:hypothetical protein